MHRYFVKIVVATLVLFVCVSATNADDLNPQPPLRVLNFQADNGFQHKSKSVALQLVERLGKKNGWEVVTTIKSASLTELDLSTFDVIVFNNNCGNKGQIMKPAEQLAFQKYIQNGGGFFRRSLCRCDLEGGRRIPKVVRGFGWNKID